jgi:hypothetical protein
MIDKAHLRDKSVVFKMSCHATSLTGTIVGVEDDGLWIVSADVVSALAKQFHLASGIQKPAVFVPICSLDWLMAASES